jgi:hypothetical protein
VTLNSGLLDLINASHENTWRRYESVKAMAIQLGLDPIKTNAWKNPGEPAFVSGLLDDVYLYQLQDMLRAQLPPGISTGTPLISSIFAHQKPYVTYQGASGDVTIELGDLLLVRHHFVFGSSQPQGRAFLLQAKTAKTPRTGNLTGGDAEQFDLYDGWKHAFTFPHGEIALPPNATAWDFSKAGAIDHTGVYGVVYSNELPYPPKQRKTSKFHGGCAWGVGTSKEFTNTLAAKTVDASKTCLASLLEKFLNGTFGREWVPRPTHDDHWSHFINGILGAARRWTFPIHRLGIQDEARCKDVLALAQAVPSAGIALAFAVHNAAPSTAWHNIERTGAHQHRFSLGSLSYPAFLHNLAYLHRGYYGYLIQDAVSQLLKWKDSVEVGGGGTDGPSGPDDQPPVPGGGIATLYVATFGDMPLPEVIHKPDGIG